MQNAKLKLVISSGKGGVGKSMLTSALTMLFSKERKVVAVDCDVDTPNLAIWLGEPGKWKKIKKISVSEKPIINNSKLTKRQAKNCVGKCRFGALSIKKEKLKLNSFLCEGCGACEIFCPKGVIRMKAVKNGEIRVKQSKYHFPLVSGQLFPGEVGSGKVVSVIKNKAGEFNSDLMLIDSAPGTGCPVIASLQDADFVLLITEPTPSGFSDLKRILKVVNHFKIPWRIVINKWDINPPFTLKINQRFKGKILGKISYDKNIFKAIASLTPILETNLKAKQEINEIYNKLKKVIF